MLKYLIYIVLLTPLTLHGQTISEYIQKTGKLAPRTFTLNSVEFEINRIPGNPQYSPLRTDTLDATYVKDIKKKGTVVINVYDSEVVCYVKSESRMIKNLPVYNIYPLRISGLSGER